MPRGLGELLVEEGLLSTEQLEQALKLSRRANESLLKILVRHHFVPEEPLLQALARQQGLTDMEGIIGPVGDLIGAEKGLRIGRTSFKLRNPKNQPPEWASTLVAAKTTQPTTLVHSDGRLATLLPIHVKTQCLMCHGRDENIPDEVKSALKKHYPADAATGFAEGDLRGWFWVEVPARVR